MCECVYSDRTRKRADLHVHMHAYQADLERAEKDLVESKKVRAITDGGREHRGLVQMWE